METKTNTKQICALITELIDTAVYQAPELEDIGLENLELLEGAQHESYAEAGLLTHSDGIVLHLADGSQFQITVTQRV